MQQTLIIYPLIGMVFLTLFIGVKGLILRIKAVRNDGLNPSYFLLNSGGKPPEYVTKYSQHYENMFELPVLFYVVSILLLVVEKVDVFYLALAWLYLISRIFHAYIHTTSNKLSIRKNIFLLSTIILYFIWSRLFIELLVS